MRLSKVRLIFPCLLAAALAGAQALRTPLVAPPAPRIGAIEYYGLHKLSEQRIQRALHLKPGDPLPPSKGDLEDRLEKVPGVVLSRLEAVCCQADGNTILFVGIEEKGAPHFAFRSPPDGNAALPESIVDTHRRLLEAIEAAGRRGSTAEDLTHGHSLMADPDARDLQQQFVAFTAGNLELLRSVLHASSDAEQRAIAATIIGYAPDKAMVVGDLEYAMQDPDESVRANAMRSLGAIAVLAAREPQTEIHIAPTWFIEMLNSLVLSDRVKAASALVNMTENDGKATLDQIRERALGSVLETAQWKSLHYALPAYILLGRIAGVSEQTIQESWSQGHRDVVIMRLARRR